MLSPVRSLTLSAGISALLVSCAAQAPYPRLAEYRAVQSQTLMVQAAGGPRLEIQGVAGSRTALLTHEGRVWRVTESDCEALRIALGEWQAFPPIHPGLRYDGAANTRIPPTSLDGYGAWTIETEAAVPGDYPVGVTLHLGGGLYTIWAEKTVRGIMRCAPQRLTGS